MSDFCVKFFLIIPLLFFTGKVFAITNLICSEEKYLRKVTISIYQKSNNLVYHEDNVTMENNKFDEFGGFTKIEVTPHLYRIEYNQKKKNFSQTTVINRLTLEMKQYGELDGKYYSNEFKCSLAKPKF